MRFYWFAWRRGLPLRYLIRRPFRGRGNVRTYSAWALWDEADAAKQTGEETEGKR